MLKQILTENDLDTHIHFTDPTLKNADDFRRLVEAGPLDAVEELFIYLEDPRKEREFWLERLGSMTNLKKLSIKSRPNQEMLEAICDIPNLERLKIWWSSITDLRPIKRLRSLTHLEIGSSPKIESISALTNAKSLVALSLDGTWPALNNIDAITKLSELRALSLGGSENVYLKVDSVVPLANLQHLEVLALFMVQPTDKLLPPIEKMGKLRHLYLSALNTWPVSEFQKLHQLMPDNEKLKKVLANRRNRLRNSVIQLDLSSGGT